MRRGARHTKLLKGSHPRGDSSRAETPNVAREMDPEKRTRGARSSIGPLMNMLIDRRYLRDDY